MLQDKHRALAVGMNATVFLLFQFITTKSYFEGKWFVVEVKMIYLSEVLLTYIEFL